MQNPDSSGVKASHLHFIRISQNIICTQGMAQWPEIDRNHPTHPHTAASTYGTCMQPETDLNILSSKDLLAGPTLSHQAHSLANDAVMFAAAMNVILIRIRLIRPPNILSVNTGGVLAGRGRAAIAVTHWFLDPQIRSHGRRHKVLPDPVRGRARHDAVVVRLRGMLGFYSHS